MKLATGIELHGNQLRITFYYRKTKCREGLNLGNTAADLKLAIQKRDDILSDIRRGKFSYEEHFPNSKRIELFNVKPKSYLMKDLLDQQIKFIEVNNSYSKYTKRDYIGYIVNYLIPVFGKIPVKQLKPIDIKEWILSCPQSPDYVANILIQLRATLADAQNDGLISESPLQKLDTKRLFQLLQNKSDYEVDPFTSDERKLIINGASGEVRWLIQFILFSGVRLGEALALKWPCVNLAEHKIKIEYTMSDGELTSPKTPSSIREIHLLRILPRKNHLKTG